MNKYQEALDFVKDNMLYWDYYDDCDLPREYYEKKKESLELLEELVKSTQDLDLIIFSAFRYALGRRTYIVPTVADFIKDNLSLFNIAEINHFIEEIEQAYKENILGDKFDKAVWLSLLTTLKQELKDREK